MTVALVLAMLSGVGVIAGLLFLANVVMWAYLILRRGRSFAAAGQTEFATWLFRGFGPVPIVVLCAGCIWIVAHSL